jgi:hypothetical protein
MIKICEKGVSGSRVTLKQLKRQDSINIVLDCVPDFN